MSIFNYGFRPFFILASVYASFLISVWMFFMSGSIHLNQMSHPQLWHGHEMIFGFAGSVLAGFLLTASANWTGMRAVQGRPLATLSFIWLIGRCVIFILGFSEISMAIDLLFWVGLILLLWPYLWNKDNPRNKIFIVILSMLGVLNLLFWVSLSNPHLISSSKILGLALEIFIGIILLILGRILPFFSSKALKVNIGENNSLIERSIALCFFVFIFLGFLEVTIYRSVCAGILFVLLGFRLRQWTPLQSLKVPLLAILYSGYLWVMFGFFLELLVPLVSRVTGFYKHAFAVGGIGILCLGMMIRVSLGHTGRTLMVGKSVIYLFLLINFGVYLRLIPPMIMPQNYLLYLQLSGVCWVISFFGITLYLVPILFSPRIDGNSG